MKEESEGFHFQSFKDMVERQRREHVEYLMEIQFLSCKIWLVQKQETQMKPLCWSMPKQNGVAERQQ